MLIQDERCWVIKNEDGYYVNAKFRALFTGLCTGFTGYMNEDVMKKDLDMLGENYHAEYIWYKDIPEGERVYLD